MNFVKTLKLFVVAGAFLVLQDGGIALAKECSLAFDNLPICVFDSECAGYGDFCCPAGGNTRVCGYGIEQGCGIASEKNVINWFTGYVSANDEADACIGAICFYPDLESTGFCIPTEPDMCVNTGCSANGPFCCEGDCLNGYCVSCISGTVVNQPCTRVSDSIDTCCGQYNTVCADDNTCKVFPTFERNCSATYIAATDFCKYAAFGDFDRCEWCPGGENNTRIDSSTGNVICTGLPEDGQCSHKCECANGANCIDGHCKATACVSAGGACVAGSENQECCAEYDGGKPLKCGKYPTNSPLFVAVAPGETGICSWAEDERNCSSVSSSTPCTNSRDCCIDETLFSCNLGTGYCVKGVSLGGECQKENSCFDRYCDPGYRCVNGYCVDDGSCYGIYENKVYQGPIIDINQLLSSIYKLLYPIAIVLGMFFIILAGYKFMTSEGDPSRVKEAQEQLTSAIIGILFIVLSVVILRLVIVQILGGTISI